MDGRTVAVQPWVTQLVRRSVPTCRAPWCDFLSHITQGCRGMCLMYLWLSSAQTFSRTSVGLGQAGTYVPSP